MSTSVSQRVLLEGATLSKASSTSPIIGYVWLQMNHQWRAHIALDAGRKRIAESLTNVLGFHASFEQPSDALLSTTFVHLLQMVEQRGLVCDCTIER